MNPYYEVHSLYETSVFTVFTQKDVRGIQMNSR